jgi:hypothetical protein
MGRRALILVAPLALVAGCGGGGGTTTKAQPEGPVFHRAPTEACLRARGFTLSHAPKRVGFIASAALGGGVRATKGSGADVILAFGNGGADAQQILAAVRKNPRLQQSAIFRYRRRVSNVVLFWAYRPTKKTAAAVDRCLRPKQR